MMLRRAGQDLESTFVTILEPYGSEPVIEATVRRQRDPAAIVLQVQLEDRTDLIAISAGDTAVGLQVSRGRHATHRGEIGVLSLGGGSDSVEFAYSLGKGGWRLGDFTLPSPDRQRSPLLRIDDTALVVMAAGESPPQSGDIVRLLTSDGWVYPFNVRSAAVRQDELVIAVAEPPRMEFDAAQRRLKLEAFPQRRHTGDVVLEWQPRAIWTQAAGPRLRTASQHHGPNGPKKFSEACRSRPERARRVGRIERRPATHGSDRTGTMEWACRPAGGRFASSTRTATSIRGSSGPLPTGRAWRI